MDRASAWLAIGFVVLLLGAIGVTEIVTGHVPTTSRPVWTALLVWVVGINGYRVLRNGRRALPVPHAVAQTGFLAFAASQLAGSDAAAWRWVGNVGCLLLLGGMLVQMVELGRPRRDVPQTR